MQNEEIARLQQELEEAQELIHAIRTGAIDALAVTGSDGPQIYTLQSADLPYRLLIERMNEGAIILNKEGFILYSNSSISSFLGIPLKNLVGSSFFELIDLNYRQQFISLFENGWNGLGRGEFMLQNKENVFVPFYISMTLMEMGNEPALAVIITNLSTKNEIKTIRNRVAQQNALIALQDKQLLKDQEVKREAERLAGVLEGLPQMAWTAKSDGTVNYFNQRWYDYTGTSSEESLVWGWKNVIHEDFVESNISAWMEVVRSGEPYEMETLFKRSSDGMYRWHLVRAKPIVNDHDQIVLWVGTCTDIHDQKTALEQLAENNKQLIKTNNDLDNFLYLASHDLKAPISNIEGLLNAFFDEVHVDEEYKHMVDMMFSSVDRFKKTILDLTEISKVHKHQELLMEPLSFEDIYKDIALDIKDLIDRKSASITTDFKIKSVKYYSKVLRSTIYNLLSNAIKYSNPDHFPQITISTESINDKVVLKVKDNGLGLTLENQQKIFKMFNRIHTNEEGSGIGLYIVKRMLENVGGKIEVESEPKKGSVFTVYL